MPEENRQWILRKRPSGPLTEDVFECVSGEVCEPEPGQALVRVLSLSLDPANRVWIMGPSYRPAVEIDAVMDGLAIGQVVRSEDPSLSVGDLVTGDLGWQQYAVRPASALHRIEHDGKRPLSHYLGVLGITGLTAYFGLLDVGRVKPSDTLLVSGAAGATGSVAGQIAKMWGCTVVGVAGTKAKCRWLVEDLGFDAAINYREQDVQKALRETCPDGIDVYFDNVGGPILDAALLSMNKRGRIICCGAISSYDRETPQPGPAGVPALLIARRLKMQGFIVMDYAARFADGVEALAGWVEAGRIVVAEDRVSGLDNAPRGLMGLLAGENRGKRYVHIADPQ